MTLQSAAFDAPRATGPREGSVAYDVLRTLEAKQPLPLSIRAIAADIGSRRTKMSPKKLVQLEETVRKSSPACSRGTSSLWLRRDPQPVAARWKTFIR